MYILYNNGIDAYLTNKGWKTYTALLNKNKNYQLIIVKNANPKLQEIKNCLEKNSKTIAKGVILINVVDITDDFPKMTVDFSNQVRHVLKSGASALVSLLMQCECLKIKSTIIFPRNQINGKVAPELLEKQAKEEVTTKKAMKSGLTLEDLNRVKSQIKYNNDFINDTITMTRSVNSVYKQATEISIYYKIILQEIDGQIQDELHFVEFNRLGVFRSKKFTKNLNKLRNKRRYIKDQLNTANMLLKSLSNDEVEKLNEVAIKLDKLNSRRYLIRSPKNFKWKKE